MRALDRKALRDLWGMRGQALAICLVVASGVATFTMAVSTMHSLTRTRSTYYDRCRFADVWTHVKRAPQTLQQQIEEIPGVNVVETRVVAEVTLDVPGMSEPAAGRLVSLPDYREPRLNQVHLRSGRLPIPGRKGEVAASEAFVLAHGFKPGDRIQAVLNGRRQGLIIVGVVLSPEYIFQIKPGDILPDDKRYGIFWMCQSELAPAFDMEGAFNDVALSLTPGASEPEVLRRLDRLTAPYGGDGAYGRIDQPSYRFVNDELTQLRAMSIISPSIFFSVAAFLLNVVLSRVIATQREQIAALKAFGYTHFEVGLHYLKMVMVVIVLGVAAGTVVGIWLGNGMTELYTQFYRFPYLQYHYDPGVLFLALGLSLGAGVLGTLNAVRKAVSLPPAEAMRPEPPADFRPTIVERLGMQRFLSSSVRMALRNLERKPVHAVLSTFAIALAVGVLILGSFSEDAVDYLMDFQFRMAQRQNVTLTFVEPSGIRAVHDVQHLPGVIAAEPFRSVPVRMRNGQHVRRIAIQGLVQRPRINRVLDRDVYAPEMPEHGLLVSAALAELLDLSVGDEVSVEIMEGQRATRRVRVTELIHDFSGTNAYMEIGALQRLVGEGETYSGVYLIADSDQTETLYRQLKDTPGVAGVGIQEAAIQSFRKTMQEHMARMRLFNIIFASIIAAGVVYNTARISLAERSRELATLRVLGFSRQEVAGILLGELTVMTVLAIPIGLVMGYAMAAGIVTAMATDLFRIPLIVDHSTYGFAVTVVLIATIVSGYAVQRQLAHLDLVAVLKSKE